MPLVIVQKPCIRSIDEIAQLVFFCALVVSNGRNYAIYGCFNLPCPLNKRVDVAVNDKQKLFLLLI